MSKSERKRVSPQDVRNNACQGYGGQDWFVLPPGVRVWTPDKAGKYSLSFLPYEIKTDDHPDKMEKGTIWYKRSFQVHHQVGANNESVVCPGSIGLPCPICQERAKLAKDYDKNEDAIRALNPQRYVAFNIVDPDDEDKIAIFAMSGGKFWDFRGGGLKKELEEGDEKNLLFYEVIKGYGKIVTVRFSDAEFAGRKYLQASRFDFADRPDMDEDEVLEKTVCLDTMWGNILPYEKIKTMFLNLTPATSATPTAATQGDVKAGTGKDPAQAPATQPAYKEGDRVQDDEGNYGTITRIKGDQVKFTTDGGKKITADLDDISPYTPKISKPLDGGPNPLGKPGDKFKLGDMVKGTDNDGKKVSGKVIEYDEDDVTIEDNDGEEFECDADDLKLVVTTTKDKTKSPDPTPAPVAPVAPATPPPSKIDVGDMIKDDDGIIGKVLKIKGDDVTYQDEKGTKYVEDIEDLEKVEATKSTPAASTAAPAALASLKEGDKVEWDDGMEEGTILKIKGDKAKVKGEDGNTVTLTLSDLKKA